MEGTGEECGFFCSLRFPYLSTMFQQFCRRLWGLILVGILSGRLREVLPYGIAASHPSLDIINSSEKPSSDRDYRDFETSTAFEYLASALPLQCSTNWAMKTQHWDLQGSIYQNFYKCNLQVQLSFSDSKTIATLVNHTLTGKRNKTE